MRLIDAERMRAEAVEPCKFCHLNGSKYCREKCETNALIKLIDNAPTVKVLKDTRPQACLNCEYCCYSEMNENGEILIKCNLGQGEKCLDGGKPE